MDDISASLTPGTGMETCLVGVCVLGRWVEGWYRGKVVTVDGDRADGEGGQGDEPVGGAGLKIKDDEYCQGWETCCWEIQ